MRERIQSRRFGLVFGAGISRGFGFPTWPTLLESIAKHPEVAGVDLQRAGDGATYKSQLLFQHFRSSRMAAEPARRGTCELDYEIEVAWKRIVHQILYASIDEERIRNGDHYLRAFLPIVKSTPLTINYNFDDTIERLLLATRTPEEQRTSRGSLTVWAPTAQIRSTDSVIYHPNGYLPYRLTDEHSQDIVLLEEAFADQLIASTSGYYSTLTNHLGQTTCLFIGLSLDDPTLRHLLRQTARVHPGHYHYYVSYRGSNDQRSRERLEAEFDTNFRVHNLITLFLDDAGLADLGGLLTLDEADYRLLTSEHGLPTTYRYFLTGSVGVGKTTTQGLLRSLRTLGEWVDPLLPEMAVDPATLGPETWQRIDEWVNDQIEKKNSRLLSTPSGIDIVDRSPLDPLCFMPCNLWSQRAPTILSAVRRLSPNRRLVKGHVIVLNGEPTIVAPRARRALREPTVEGLRSQQEILGCLFPIDADGVTHIDTRERTPAEVAHAVADVIHRREYLEFDLHQRLLDASTGNLTCTCPMRGQVS